jgi:hypothetical protein
MIPFELLYGEKPILHDYLKIFDEIKVVTTKDKIQTKLTNQGTCIFVGYMEHYSRDVCRMLNLTTNSIINSRDIIWLNKTYGEWNNNNTTISTAEHDTIELPTGINKRKLITNATKDTEDEVSDPEKKDFKSYEKIGKLVQSTCYQTGRRLQSRGFLRK